MMFEKIWEWLATFVLIIGVYLTAVNDYPLNIYFSMAGNFMWMVLGVMWKKASLITIQLVVTVIYIYGMCLPFFEKYGIL
jgi:hypothetical protein